MKKSALLYAVIFSVLFALFGCGCKKEETISKEVAIEVLKESLVQGNVEITTTTETVINNIKSISTQKDIYYQNKYYHLSEDNNVSTKTWYGEINDVVYAFYYTKNTNNEETKTSSRIEQNQLESIKKQHNSLINNLFDVSGNLLESYQITASKKGKTYHIQITSSSESESNTYDITLADAKIAQIIHRSNIASNYIKTTYDYNYLVEDIQLPSFSEYPLNVNG